MVLVLKILKITCQKSKLLMIEFFKNMIKIWLLTAVFGL